MPEHQPFFPVTVHTPTEPTTVFPVGFAMFSTEDAVLFHGGKETPSLVTGTFVLPHVSTDAVLSVADPIVGEVKIVGRRDLSAFLRRGA